MKFKRYIQKSVGIYIIGALILMSVLLLGGTSFALIQKSIVGDKTLSLQTGNFLIEFTNSNAITLTNKMPIYDNDGLKSGDELSFSVTNNGSYRASYSIKIEETGDGNLKDVIRYGVDYGNGYEINNVHALKNNPYIIQDKSLDVGKMDNYNVSFWIDIDASEKYAMQEFNAKIKIEATQEEYKYATDVIEKVYEKTRKDGVLAINNRGEFALEDEIWEYRYSGIDVNNYVWFNCKDGYTNGIGHCEKWRIIGNMYNTYENGIGTYRVLKIVRDKGLELKDEYNSLDDYLADFHNSSIRKYLNESYYNEFGNDTKKLILKAEWNTGNTMETNLVSRSYGRESERNIYNYVGLLNLSDYGYANNQNLWKDPLSSKKINGNNNWLYLEDVVFLNTPNYGASEVYYVTSLGLTRGEAKDEYIIRPVVYLKPDVSIIGGMGTASSPYELGIKYPMFFGVKTAVKLK